MIIDSSERRRVLIVDDYQKVRDLLVELLDDKGYEVAAAADAAAAMDLISSFAPDLVISDVVMPVMDGIELCRQLKQSALTANVPVLLISGARNSADDNIEGLRAGADDYLDVPFSNDELLVKVARLTERHRIEKHYREIVEEAADIIYTCDMAGYLTSINVAGTRFFGRSAAELVGIHLRELIGADAAARDLEETQNLLVDTPLRSLFCLKDAQGAARHLEAVLTVDRDRHGQPASIRAVVRDVTEQKLAEVALKDSEERYRRLVELSPEAIVVHRGGNFIYLNPAAQKLLGTSSAKELIGKPILDVVHPDYRELVKSRVRRIEQKNVPTPAAEEKLVTLDGRVVDVEVRGMPFTFQGDPAIQAVITDITDRKRMEAEREVIYQIIQGVNITPDLDELLVLIHRSISKLLYAENCFVALHDPQTDFISFEFWADKFDPVPPPRPVGQGFSSYILKTGQPILLPREQAEEMYARGEVQRSGTSSALWLGVPLRTPSRIIGVLVVQHYEDEHAYDERDLEFLTTVGSQIALAIERKRAEEALRQGEAQYRRLVDHIPDVVWTADDQGNAVFLSERIRTFFGYTPEECYRDGGQLRFERMHPADKERVQGCYAKLFSDNQPYNVEYRMRHRGGHWVWWHDRAVAIYEKDGIRYADGLLSDISERKSNEERIGLLQTITKEVSETKDLSSALEVVLRHVCETTGWIFGQAWIPRSDGGVLECSSAWFASTAGLEQFRAISEDSTCLSGAGLPGRVWASKKPAWIRDATVDRNFPRAKFAREAGLKAGLGIPILAGDEVIAIIEFFMRERQNEDERLVSLISTIAAQLGLVIERKRAEKELQQRAERETITNHISRAVRRSLDVEEVFETAVRELGTHLHVDRCSLYLKDEKAGRAINAAEYRVPDVEPAGYDFELPQLGNLIDAMKEHGVLAFTDPANDDHIVDFYESVLRKANVRSIMYVAIRIGDDVPAAFALSTTRQQRQWSEADIAVAKAVADHTGIAIRQARLYQKAEATSTREALVNGMSQAIRASLSLPDMLSAATRGLGRALFASRVYVRLYDPANPRGAISDEYLEQGCVSARDLEISYDDPTSPFLLNSLEPIVITDLLNYSGGSPEFNERIRHTANAGVKSQIDYPLIVDGEFRGVICIHQTDRVRHWTEDELLLVEAVAVQLAAGIAQAELFEMVARAKREWETTFDAMSDGVFIFDRVGQLKRVNRAGAAMEQSHPRAVLGRKCCDILRTSAQDEGCVVEKAIEDGTSITIEITPERLNRPMLVSVEPVLNKGDEALAVVCTVRDLSELRKVQAVAREHQSLLTNILESARESIYAVDTEGRFKWCNGATLASFGYKRDEVIGRPLFEMIYEADRQLVDDKLQAALEGEAQTYEMRYVAHDGCLRYARVDNSPLVVEGRTTGILGIARDITEQKEERERAARADKLRALGQLASGVAHDFNNSLAAILGRAQLLRRQIKDDALVRNLDIIQTAAEDAAATVRRIQTFARKAPATEFEMLDLRGLLHDAIEITRTRWQNEARLSGLNYQVKLEAQSGQYTIGSASELREVFVNLIVNAVDAMPGGGELSIRCVREATQLHLQFTDSGTGMPDDVRQKIFEPFFTTKGTQGTGLGLSVSYSIIERHGGSISVASEIGSGTVFSIELPAAAIDTSPKDKPATLTEMPSLSILVVDDEPIVRETLADMLQALNHRVVLAESGPQALQKLAGTHLDLVFTDLAMPEMDGWETAREIRKRWPQMSIVLVTGYGPGTVPPSGESDLVDGIIGKPFDFAQVSQTLNEVLGKKNTLENVGA